VFPIEMLVAGLVSDQESLKLAVSQFEGMSHPELKMLLAVTAFEKSAETPAILAHLRNAFADPRGLAILENMLGTDLAAFKSRVLARLDSDVARADASLSNATTTVHPPAE